MEYNDFPDLQENIIEKMAVEYRNKVLNVNVLDNESGSNSDNNPESRRDEELSEFFSELSQGIQIGISFLEILMKFSRNIFKIRKLKTEISSALEREKKELNLLSVNHLQTATQPPHWGGFFRKNCNTFFNSEFLLLYLLMRELKRNEPAMAKEKIIDMVDNHINNIKMVSSLLI